MSFDDMMNDVVTLVKKDGTVVKEGIKAQVSKGSIITFDASFPIEPGDHFVRIQQSGLAEDYIVIDPGYMSGMGGGPEFRTISRAKSAAAMRLSRRHRRSSTTSTAPTLA